MDVSETTCRICCKPGNMITPCFCRGVFAFAHQSCLNNWLEETKSEYCDICRFKYKTIKYPRNFFDWVMMEAKGRVDLMITIGVHFFLFYFFLFGGFIWFNSLGKINFSLSLFLLTFTLFLSGITICSIYSFIGAELTSYNDWIRNNFKITVLNNPDSTTEPPTPPKRATRSSGVSKGSLKLNYKSSLSSDSF